MTWADLPDDLLRSRLRAWLAENYPAAWRKDSLRPFRRLRGADLIAFLQRLHAAGLRAPAWPAQYGGMGLSFTQQRVYHDEFERAQVARLIDFGEQMLGPVLMSFGSEQQRRELLPRILDCRDIWCQGYSEPGAGSDLASLTTRAKLLDDRFIVDGQKTWTTHAQDATHMFALVRTQAGGRKQEGISFLLIDLAQAGVSIRPILNIAGEAEYCEVFLDGVVVPRQGLVGELHQGWSVAKALLRHERIWVGNPALCRDAFDLARRLVEARGLASDQGVVDRLTELALDLHDYEALYDGVCSQMEADGSIPQDVGMLKVLATELQQRLTEFVVDTAGEEAALTDAGEVEGLPLDVHWQFMMSRPITIFGGANAVQRDMLATSVLRLPRRT